MPMLGLEIMPTTIARLIRQGGGIKITHDVYSSQQMLDLVSTRQVEIGIGQLIGERADIEIIASYRACCVCAMLPDHPLGDRDVLTPRDLKGHDLIALAHHTAVSGYVTKAFAEANVQPRIVVESQPSYTACGLVAAGVGVALVDPLTPRAFRADLRLVPFRPAIPFDFHVFRSKAAPQSRASVAFCAHLAEVLEGFAEVDRIGP